MPIQAPVYNLGGDLLREVELPDSIFAIEPNRGVMHQALVRQMANARRGTHKSQTRGEVSRTTAKWYRQKGTGRARHGSRRAPIFVGGGVAHGPRPRSYAKKMPKKMRQLALRSALAARAAEGAIILVDDMHMDSPKTKTMKGFIDAACEGASSLVLLSGAEGQEAVERSLRNLPRVRYLKAGYLNVRDLLGFERVVLPLDALEAVTAHLGSESGGDA